MSYDDYVRHIAQKYRLAISIAVISSKPENMALEDYVEQLRSSINDDRMDSDDLNISICSDDFNIDQSDDLTFNIDENGDIYNNNVTFPNTNDIVDQLIEINDVAFPNNHNLDDGDINIDQSIDKLQDNQILNDKNDQINHCDETNDVETINTQDLNDSITILHNFDEVNAETDVEIQQRSSLKDVMKILKIIDNNMTTIDKEVTRNNTSVLTNEDTFRLQTSDKIGSSQCFKDNDVILCESFNILPQTTKRKRNQDHIHSSNQDNKQPTNHTDGQAIINKPTHIQANSTFESIVNNINEENKKNSSKKTKVDTSTSEIETKSKQTNTQTQVPKADNTIRGYRHTKHYKNIYQNVAGIFDTKKKETVYERAQDHIIDKNYLATNRNEVLEVSKESITNLNEPVLLRTANINNFKDIVKDSQESVLYTKPDDSTCTGQTHYSESQVNDIFIIDEKFIRGNINKKQDCIETTKQNQSTFKNKSVTDGNKMSAQETPTYLPTLVNNSETSQNKIESHKNDPSTTNKLQDNTNYKRQAKYNDFSRIPVHRNANKQNDQEAIKICDRIQDNSTFNTNENVLDSVKYIDKDIFSQESEFANFSQPSASCNQNLTENSLVFSQNAQNMDITLTKQSNNENIKNIAVRKNCTVFEDISKRLLISNQVRSNTNFDGDSNLTQNKNNVQAHRTSTYNATLEDIHQIEEHNRNNPNFANNTQLGEENDTQKEATPSKFQERFKNMLVTENCTNLDKSLEMEVEGNSQTELIPFKIIEELNKVKMYVNRKNDKKVNSEGYSSDAGYRSDSQSRNSLILSQSSGWLNQSAFCLINYIKESPLVSTTQGITYEISVILGKLIDKLHENEQYPSFLEELLETVNSLLSLVYEDNSDENSLLKKDESIHRVLLFNKSIHIQKYTIERITHILENLHKELSVKDSLYEINNVDQIENVCYIFHILELLLQRYNKSSVDLSQKTQYSQEDEKILKKSNIMDIWKKKWNPNYKESTNASSQEEKSVLNNCSSVLNKLIVDCIDGYSLVSYFALKCFNVMQS